MLIEIQKLTVLQGNDRDLWMMMMTILINEASVIKAEVTLSLKLTFSLN